MSTIPNREIKNLSSKDVSKRRKAIRMLFESDDENNLQYFSKLITDDDPWFRSKAYEAYKMWAPRIGTKAFEYEDQIKETIKQKRLEKVINLQKEHSILRNKRLIGSIQTVLVEKQSKMSSKHWAGRTDSNKWVIFNRIF